MAKSPPDFNASASGTGYLYQIRCALLWLLDADDDAAVSLEKSDDVTFEKDGSPEEKLQTKHHIDRTASLTDASADLWKTIRVWSEDVFHGRLTATTRLALVTTGVAPSGSIAAMLKSKSEYRDEPTALARLNDVSTKSENESLKSAFSAFNLLTDDLKKNLVSRIRVLDAVQDIQGVGHEVCSRLRVAADQNKRAIFNNAAEGWWFQRIVEHWSQGDRGFVSRVELHNALGAIRESLRHDSLPADFLERVDEPESAIPTKERKFIEQLRRINLPPELISDARSDYRRAFNQKSRWLREELVHEPELDAYNDKLVQEWRLLFYPSLQDSEGENESQRTKRGRNLYLEIQKRHIPIKPTFEHFYFMRGSYHSLANVPRVCWHPNLHTELKDATGGRGT